MSTHRIPTDYILFVHGVNTRDENQFEQDTADFFENIKKFVPATSNRKLKYIPFFWGDLNIAPQDELRAALEGSDATPEGKKIKAIWDQFWFKKFRTGSILPFAGDAALYLSQHISAKVLEDLCETVTNSLPCHPHPDDRLHIVTHSWGTVVLFDILFGSRWDNDPDVRDQHRITTIRHALFGVPPQQQVGIRLASIHTMGSPIALFNLINMSEEQRYDLTPRLKEMLEYLYKGFGQQIAQAPLPWRNYAHPGDPIAYPLTGIMKRLLNGERKYVDIQDVISRTNPLLRPFRQTILPLVDGGKAHGSYWTDPQVSRTIAQVIHETRTTSLPPAPAAPILASLAVA